MQSWEQYQDKIDAIVEQAMHVGRPQASCRGSASCDCASPRLGMKPLTALIDTPILSIQPSTVPALHIRDCCLLDRAQCLALSSLLLAQGHLDRAGSAISSACLHLPSQMSVRQCGSAAAPHHCYTTLDFFLNGSEPWRVPSHICIARQLACCPERLSFLRSSDLVCLNWMLGSLCGFRSTVETF